KNDAPFHVPIHFGSVAFGELWPNSNTILKYTRPSLVGRASLCLLGGRGRPEPHCARYPQQRHAAQRSEREGSSKLLQPRRAIPRGQILDRCPLLRAGPAVGLLRRLPNLR